MRILAIVITYYPEKELMEKNVSAFIDDVNKVLIWENTPESDKLKYRFIEHEKVEYCGDGINSISHGLNYGWHYANNGGYDYLLTMDQDSILINFAAMKEYVKSHIYERIIIGPSLNMDDIQFASVNNDIIEAKKVDTLITSGSLFYVVTLNELEGWDENLIIDGVDTDLILRADSKGIYAYQVKNCNLRQRFGEPQVGRFWGKRHEFSIYSSNRLKSILRAHIYLIRKYKSMSSVMRKYIIRHYIKEKMIEIILFENHKVSKLAAMLIGIYQGFKLKV